MRELTQVLRFSPRTIEDEMRIYRAKPIAWTDSSVALLNEYGATLCRVMPSQGAKTLRADTR